MSETNERAWTPEEQALIEAAQTYFAAIAACEAAGGSSGEAMLAAMPAEAREQMPMLGALGL